MTATVEPIAITGMACRFPAAPSLDAFWRLLREGRHGVGPVPPERWDCDAVFDSDPKEKGKSNTRVGGFIADVDRFDAAFFGISPREATQMDPQQRILLELAYEALEDAGINPAQLAGSDTAVYVGAMTNDYLRHQLQDGYRRVDVHTGAGAGLCMLANRLSYQFDLCGPSVAVDTACSSSLVAVFQACQSLWTRQSRLAIAAGVNVILDPAFSVFYAKAGLSAPDGRCKTFSAAADGIGRGEGAGVLVLKPLRDAIASEDPIYAVIRGGAINQDGRSNGMTQPNRWAQERLLRSALLHADVDGRSLEYVELHGTGTLIGDPIEANALGSVLADEGAREHPCLVGSVKTNLGHLEAAAGIAGLIKLALSLYHGEIPPSLWFDAPNPHIDFERLPLQLNAELTPWVSATGVRTGGISSFGLGGTNAHLVVQSVAACESSSNRRPHHDEHWLMLSARSEAALRRSASACAQLLAASPHDVTAICSAARRRKGVHDVRLSVVARDAAGMSAALEAFVAGGTHEAIVHGRYRSAHRRMMLALPDEQGVEVSTFARWLTAFPLVRTAWNDARAALSEHASCDLPAPELLDRSSTPCDDRHARGWRFAAHYALLTQMLGSFEEIDRILADGPSQLAALCASGALSLELAAQWLAADLEEDFLREHAVELSYRVTSDFPDGVNCASITLAQQRTNEDWRERMQRELARSSATASRTSVVVLNLGAGVLDARTGSEACGARLFVASESPQRMFAELALQHAIRWETTAYREAFVRLPAYPWQRESFWIPREWAIDAGTRRVVPEREGAAHELLVTRMDGPIAIWSTALDTRELPWLADHRVQGFTVLPGSAYAEIGLAVQRALAGPAGGALKNIEFHKALIIDDAQPPAVHVVFDEHAQRYAVHTRHPNSGWQLHGRGELAEVAEPASRIDVATLQARCTQHIAGSDHYANMRSRGFQYGPYFQGVRELWLNPDSHDVLAWIEAHEPLKERADDTLLHPSLLDAALQTLLTPLTARGDTELYIPTGICKLELHRSPGEGFWCYGTLAPSPAGIAEGDVVLFDRDGEVIARAAGVRAQAVTQNDRKDDTAEEWFYRYVWESEPSATSVVGQGNWLVFANEGGEAFSLIERLRSAGAARVITVRRGTEFEQSGVDEFRIGPASAEDMQRVVGRAGELDSAPLAGVIYCWGIDLDDDAVDSEHAPEEVIAATHLLRALDGAASSAPLTVVTQAAQYTSEGDALPSLLQAMLVALARVAINEFPRQIVRCVDIDRDTDTLAALACEMAAPALSDEIALRGTKRFVHRLRRAASTEIARREPKGLGFRGTHLITGGCSGFGLEFAQWLSLQGAEQLVLVGRRGASTPEAQRALDEMRARGTQVHVASIDVSIEAQVARLLAEIAEGMPPLKGVYHAAAVLDDAPIVRLEPRQIAQAMAAKVRGAWYLHRHTRELPLEHFVLFSSIASLLGGAGQASYAMACACLDALAHRRSASRLPAASLNWGALSEVGMAARFGDAEQQLARTGVGSFTPAQAVKLLGRTLNWLAPQLGIAKMDWRSWGKTYPAFAASPRHAALCAYGAPHSQTGAAAPMREKMLQLEASAREGAAVAALVEMTAAVMEAAAEDIDPETSLLSLGIDSLMALDLQAGIERDFGLRVSTLELMKGTSLQQLAQHLTSSLLTSQQTMSAQQAMSAAAKTANPSAAPIRTLDEMLASADAQALLASLEDLSSEDIDRVLAQLA